MRRAVAAASVLLAVWVPGCEPAHAAQPTETWARLADCESGEWDRHARPIAGTADWNSRVRNYEGGVHFDYRTWDAYRPAHFAPSAAGAHIFEQVYVAEAVLKAQGWARAWPVCSRKLGLR